MGKNEQSGNMNDGKELSIGDDYGEVHVRKIVSKKGERLEIENDGSNIKLDALLLESISWQRDRGELTNVINSTSKEVDDPIPQTGGNSVEEGAEISISNEYSHVKVDKVTTSNGEGLQIKARGRGSAINLGAKTLRDLAAHENTFAFSPWFETPFGPEDTSIEGPL